MISHFPVGRFGTMKERFFLTHNQIGTPSAICFAWDKLCLPDDLDYNFAICNISPHKRKLSWSHLKYDLVICARGLLEHLEWIKPMFSGQQLQPGSRNSIRQRITWCLKSLSQEQTLGKFYHFHEVNQETNGHIMQTHKHTRLDTIRMAKPWHKDKGKRQWNPNSVI